MSHGPEGSIEIETDKQSGNRRIRWESVSHVFTNKKIAYRAMVFFMDTAWDPATYKNVGAPPCAGVRLAGWRRRLCTSPLWRACVRSLSILSRRVSERGLRVAGPGLRVAARCLAATSRRAAMRRAACAQDGQRSTHLGNSIAMVDPGAGLHCRRLHAAAAGGPHQGQYQGREGA